MRADVNERVDLFSMTQGQVKSRVAVPRRARGIVVTLLTVATRAAIGLQKDSDVTRSQARETKVSIDDRRVCLRSAPSRLDLLPDTCGKCCEPYAIVCERDGENIACRPIREASDDFVCGPRDPACFVTGAGEVAHDLAHAFRCIEPAGISRAPGARGIVRDDERHVALAARFMAEPRPCAGKPCNERYPIFCALVDDRRILQGGIGLCLGLKGDRAREYAPIELGQHDVHRQITWRQSPG